jgi:hypothetical protein
VTTFASLDRLVLLGTKSKQTKKANLAIVYIRLE